METFTPDETCALAPYFTNTDKPIFALTNLPETVKGALFARYSRSAKSVRRLFLDEFLGQVDEGATPHTSTVGVGRADKLYARLFRILARVDTPERARAEHACTQLAHSTVTDLARLRGWSTSVPLCTAVR